MDNLEDLIPVRLTNSDDKYKWLNNVFKSANTDDGKAVVAVIALLIDEVNKLQDAIGELQDLVNKR